MTHPKTEPTCRSRTVRIDPWRHRRLTDAINEVQRILDCAPELDAARELAEPGARSPLTEDQILSAYSGEQGAVEFARRIEDLVRVNLGNLAAQREQLAALCHDQWSGWMKYMFARMNGRTLPTDLHERSERQSKTLYRDLSEDEKDSNRREADRFLRLLGAA